MITLTLNDGSTEKGYWCAVSSIDERLRMEVDTSFMAAFSTFSDSSKTAKISVTYDGDELLKDSPEPIVYEGYTSLEGISQSIKGIVITLGGGTNG